MVIENTLRGNSTWTLNDGTLNDRTPNEEPRRDETSSEGMRTIERASTKSLSASAEGNSLESSTPKVKTVLGSKCRLKGEFVFNEPTEIHGFVEGKIVSESELVIGETAEVRAEIRGEVIKVFGKVIGDVRAANLLEMKAQARISGNIASTRVIMHDGVQFDGSCRMGESVDETQLD